MLYMDKVRALKMKIYGDTVVQIGVEGKAVFFMETLKLFLVSCVLWVRCQGFRFNSLGGSESSSE